MGALLVLILPLGAAAWAFGNYAASNERIQTDARLDASLRAAASEYGRVVDNAQLRAIQLATQKRVQLALRDRDHATLTRLRRANRDLRFLVGERREPRSRGSVQRSVSVVSGNRVVGSIVADVTLDRPTLAKIAVAAGLTGLDEIAAAVRGNRVVAASVPISASQTAIGTVAAPVVVGGETYRAIAQPPSKATRLAILAPSDTVENAADTIRTRIVAIGLIVLAAVMLIAYTLAPLLARTRVAQEQSDRIAPLAGS